MLKNAIRPFDFSNVKLNWFPGHMATGIKQIRSRIQNDIDLVIEVRDARIPLSSASDLIVNDLASKAKDKIIVYTKKDLALPEANMKLVQKGTDTKSILYCKDDKRDLQKLFDMTKAHFKNSNSDTILRKKRKIMVVGIPNVGKSTIINGLRLSGLGFGGKAVKVGNLAGVTRNLSELVCISRDPLLYLIDTPGILPPKIGNAEEGLKIALCGGLYDKTVGFELLADYLLHILIMHDNLEFKDFYDLSRVDLDDFELKSLLPIVARRIGALLPGGELNLERAAAFFVRQFRQGKFGRFTLD